MPLIVRSCYISARLGCDHQFGWATRMSDVFEDRLRAAVGIPTAAERKAEADRLAREKLEWERSESKRKEYLACYT